MDGRGVIAARLAVRDHRAPAGFAPAFAAPGPTRLSDGGVSDRTVMTTDTVTVTVAYRNREGSPADWVRVRIGGSTHAMTRTGGDDWKREVRFGWSGKLPAGTHDITFQAMSRDHSTTRWPPVRSPSRPTDAQADAGADTETHAQADAQADAGADPRADAEAHDPGPATSTGTDRVADHGCRPTAR